MRALVLILPLALAASPVLAQSPTQSPTPTQAAPSARPAPLETITVPPALTDPSTADRLARMMQALSKAFLDLPVGELAAAAEGRPATRAERRQTLRDVGRKDDPSFERDLDRELAMSRGTIQASMKVLAAALPAMMKGLSEAGRELEKATANMPSPTYPRR
jgi:hypothetical protein